MESERLSDSALAASRHLRGNCGARGVAGGWEGAAGGRSAGGYLRVSQEARIFRVSQQS